MRFCNKLLKALLPFIGMAIVIFAFHYTDLIFFKYYPPIVNFCFFVVFFSSIFQEKTVIQKMALIMEPSADEFVMLYTRRLTYVWSAFMFINFLVSFATIFLSKTIRTLYNGFISYMLVGIFFGVEYIVRINFKRKHERDNQWFYIIRNNYI